MSFTAIILFQLARQLYAFPRRRHSISTIPGNIGLKHHQDFHRSGNTRGVDEGCRDRLVDIEGIPADKVMLLLNAVDLTRVPLRSRALETRPLRAIAFNKFRSHLPILRAACERAGLDYAELGLGANRVVSHPEEELVRYDIVFATGRCALEAACGGSAVICCDERGLGGLVVSANYDQFRRNNFGLRAMTRALTVEAVLDEIRKYNRDDAIAVSARAREDADLTKWLNTVGKNLLPYYQ